MVFRTFINNIPLHNELFLGTPFPPRTVPNRTKTISPFWKTLFLYLLLCLSIFQKDRAIITPLFIIRLNVSYSLGDFQPNLPLYLSRSLCRNKSSYGVLCVIAQPFLALSACRVLLKSFWLWTVSTTTIKESIFIDKYAWMI